MIQNILYSIKNFFYRFTQSELILIGISAVTVIIALIALFTALGLYRKHRRSSDVKRMMTILSSLDLLYYSLEKHVRAWKSARGDGQSAEAQKFWRFTDLTELVTRLQELKTLSRIHLDRKVHLELTAFLEYLSDLILISYRGENLSERDYKKRSLISSDDFDLRLNLLILKVSRGLSMKNKNLPDKEDTDRLIDGILLR